MARLRFHRTTHTRQFETSKHLHLSVVSFLKINSTFALLFAINTQQRKDRNYRHTTIPVNNFLHLFLENSLNRCFLIHYRRLLRQENS